MPILQKPPTLWLFNGTTKEKCILPNTLFQFTFSSCIFLSFVLNFIQKRLRAFTWCTLYEQEGADGIKFLPTT